MLPEAVKNQANRADGTVCAIISSEPGYILLSISTQIALKGAEVFVRQ